LGYGRRHLCWHPGLIFGISMMAIAKLLEALIPRLPCWRQVTALVLGLTLSLARLDADPLQATRAVADIGGGIALHYVEQGSGLPLIFVHGSLGDYSYWNEQLDPFSRHYRVIAYSRRYNFPNNNPAQPGYSALTDAKDLAALIVKLHLGKVYLIGHSYGALTTLILAIEHPELIRAAVLAEPPVISLLQHLPDEQAGKGDAMFADIQKRMVRPMRQQFARGNTEEGVETFIDYVFNDASAWSRMSQAERAATLRDAHEWEVMMTKGELFPEVDPAAIRQIRVPVLIMSGGVSYEFLQYIDQELARLIPSAESIVYPDAGHQMWLKYPQLCRDDAVAFFPNTYKRWTCYTAPIRQRRQWSNWELQIGPFGNSNWSHFAKSSRG
jgi:non-heme chloroperoxidase